MNSPCRPIAALVVATLAGTGCYTTSPSMQTATGTLKVDGEMQDYPAYVDSSFNYHEAGTDYIFKSYNVGETEVDELTFFHVAGETEKVEQVLKWRKAANNAALAGWGITGLGIGAAAAGAVILTANSDDVETFVTTPLGQAAFGLMGVGGVVVGLAFYSWTLLGPDRPLNRHDLVLDPTSDGEDAAKRGNERRDNALINAGGATPPEAPTE